MKIKIISKQVLTSGNTTVAKVKIADGYCFAEGDGKARCADGDEFDKYTGETIACKRAVIKATKKLIKEHSQFLFYCQRERILYPFFSCRLFEVLQ